MSARALWLDWLTAVQFLTRIPVGTVAFDDDSLSRAAKFFPLVGLLVGALAAAVHDLLARHLARPVSAFFAVLFVVMVTGCFHEDGLADAADGFGGGWTREKVLLIMRDSRIGTYGAAALILSLGGRVVMLSVMPLEKVTPYLMAAHVLCRWTTLPLSHYLPAARTEGAGLGGQIAQLTSRSTLIAGTISTLIATGLILRVNAIAPIAGACAVTFLSGRYYRQRIGGVTGDCFGATNQVTELAAYFCGAWRG